MDDNPYRAPQDQMKEDDARRRAGRMERLERVVTGMAVGAIAVMWAIAIAWAVFIASCTWREWLE